MKKWEYFTTFLFASVGKPGVNEYIKKNHPDVLDDDRAAPETMIPELDEYGKKGWELVHMQPVLLTEEGVVRYPVNKDEFSVWYFCVFKRRKRK